MSDRIASLLAACALALLFGGLAYAAGSGNTTTSWRCDEDGPGVCTCKGGSGSADCRLLVGSKICEGDNGVATFCCDANECRCSKGGGQCPPDFDEYRESDGHMQLLRKAPNYELQKSTVERQPPGVDRKLELQRSTPNATRSGPGQPSPGANAKTRALTTPAATQLQVAPPATSDCMDSCTAKCGSGVVGKTCRQQCGIVCKVGKR